MNRSSCKKSYATEASLTEATGTAPTDSNGWPTEWLEKHGARLLGFLERKTGNRHDAEDLLQETLVRFFRTPDRFAELPNPTAWLYRVAMNLLISQWRKQKPAPLSDAMVSTRPDPSQTGPLQSLIQAEEQNDLWTIAARTLRESQFHVLWFFYVEELSIQEVARLMGKTKTGVKVLLYRARKSLGNTLSAQEASSATRRTIIPLQEGQGETESCSARFTNI